MAKLLIRKHQAISRALVTTLTRWAEAASSFRKGQTVVHMMFTECPCDANAIKPLAATSPASCETRTALKERTFS